MPAGEYFTSCKVCGTVIPMGFNYNQGPFGLCPFHSPPTYTEPDKYVLGAALGAAKAQRVTELARPRCIKPKETTETFDVSEADIEELLRELEQESDEKDRTSTLVVNLFAGPGCGKSSIAAGVFHDLKWKGVECEMALEFAKDLVWEERHQTFDDQIYLFGKQHHRIFRLLGQVKVVITDCPILLSPIYDKEKRPTFEELVLEEHSKMWTYNVFLKRLKPYSPKGRIHDEREAKDLDRSIIDLLTKYQIPFETMDGSPFGKDAIVKKIMMLLEWKRNQNTPYV